MEFRQRIYTKNELREMHRNLLVPRMIEEKMLVLLRQGKISKWFSGIGQEAISVGAAMAMEEDEYMLPMHRNLGVFTTRGVPMQRLFAQWQGKMSGFTKGRDRSFHFGTQEFKIVGMISHLGPQMGIADGIGLAHLLNEEKKCALVFTGDGGTSEGDFHEAMNTAAVWGLPVIFVIENNGYGLSTPSSEQFKCKQFIDKGIGYGIRAEQVDGNNVIDVYDKVRSIAKDIREKPEPVLLECMTFRMRGHEEASGTKYVPQELMDEWAKKDPVDRYQEWLIAEGMLTEAEVETLRKEIKAEIDAEWAKANEEEAVVPDTDREVEDLYKSFELEPIPSNGSTEKMRLIDAVHNALDLALDKHPNLVYMGQDIAEYGGVFKATEGLADKYGNDRVRNTPLCESAILGAGLGLSIKGMKAMVEMQFADFVTEGFNQIVNNLAKIHWRWGQNADVVVRMPTGAGVAAGPFHSQSNESWFYHTPGLKIAYPAFPADAKGLLLTAFEDSNPVMFFEHKALYRSIEEDVSADYYTIPFGQANVLKEGEEVSIITYGQGVHWALKYAETNPDHSIEIIDLRTLAPLDTETIFDSVKKTGKAIVLYEDTLTGGLGSDIAALITESCFEYLDAPVRRCASLDTPVPFAADLEHNFLAVSRLSSSIEDILRY